GPRPPQGAGKASERRRSRAPQRRRKGPRRSRRDHAPRPRSHRPPVTPRPVIPKHAVILSPSPLPVILSPSPFLVILSAAKDLLSLLRHAPSAQDRLREDAEGSQCPGMTTR